MAIIINAFQEFQQPVGTKPYVIDNTHLQATSLTTRTPTGIESSYYSPSIHGSIDPRMEFINP
jgi:hypothetical protein